MNEQVIEHFTDMILWASSISFQRLTARPCWVTVPWRTLECCNAIHSRKQAFRYFRFIQHSFITSTLKHNLPLIKLNAKWEVYVSPPSRASPLLVIWNKIHFSTCCLHGWCHFLLHKETLNENAQQLSLNFTSYGEGPYSAAFTMAKHLTSLEWSCNTSSGLDGIHNKMLFHLSPAA
jgi:hypothetical protein